MQQKGDAFVISLLGNVEPAAILKQPGFLLGGRKGLCADVWHRGFNSESNPRVANRLAGTGRASNVGRGNFEAVLGALQTIGREWHR